MSGSSIRTLAALVLVFATSPAMAQSAAYVTEYHWLTLFGEAQYAFPSPDGPGVVAPTSVFEALLSRAFVTLETDGRLTGPSAHGRHFRDPEPEFAHPAAFRRPRQARLSFSVRF